LKTARLLALMTAAAFVISCAPSSEEARLRAFLKETVALAEKRDLAGVMARLGEDYSDFEGRDKAAAEALIRDYFRQTGIVIHLLGMRVQPVGPEGQATVEAEALLSSGAAEVFRKLIRFAGECYRFEVRLTRALDSSWRVVWARWDAVPLSELFPESLAVLKKLFPEY
jgi:hypothetical protein